MDLTEETITAFAEHLIPEAFTTASTAVRVELRAPTSAEWMGEWVASCLRDAVAARDLMGEQLGGVIFVQRRDERWRWDLPHPIWPLDTLAENVRCELSGFPEPAVFIGALQDRQRQQLIAQLRGHAEELPWTMPWYAEERSRARAQIMNGDAHIGEGAQPSRGLARDRRLVERAGRRLLSRHPSRRRFRLQ